MGQASPYARSCAAARRGSSASAGGTAARFGLDRDLFEGIEKGHVAIAHATFWIQPTLPR